MEREDINGRRTASDVAILFEVVSVFQVVRWRQIVLQNVESHLEGMEEMTVDSVQNLEDIEFRR